MSLRTTDINNANFAIWLANTNLLATDVGDLASLTTDITTSIVAALNGLQDQVDNIMIKHFFKTCLSKK